MISFLAVFDPDAGDPTASGRRDHYAGLDALRGVAALAVVWFHLAERLDLPAFIQHGYLAVDFFFVLSGFVLARAYAGRLAAGSLPVGRFCLIRLIRLLPLVIAGTLMAAAIEWNRPSIVDQTRHLTDTAVAVLMGSALLPILWPTTLEQVIFPLNGPAWSLFFEAVSNLAFAPAARARAGRVVLPAILLISGAALLIASGRFDGLHFGSDASTFWWGFPRVAWSFAIGIALFTMRARAPRLPFAVPALGLIIMMLIPDLGAGNALFDDVCVLVLLPLVVFAASTARFGRAGRWMAAISGDLSYPLYATHYPIARAIGFVGLRLHLPLPGRLAVLLGATIVIVAAAALIYVFYDRPARRRLTRLLSARRRRLYAEPPPA